MCEDCELWLNPSHLKIGFSHLKIGFSHLKIGFSHLKIGFIDKIMSTCKDTQMRHELHRASRSVALIRLTEDKIHVIICVWPAQILMWVHRIAIVFVR